jgi:hypothetical protein
MLIEVTETVTVGREAPVMNERTVHLKVDDDPTMTPTEAASILNEMRQVARDDLGKWEHERRMENYVHMRRTSMIMIMQLASEGHEVGHLWSLVMRHVEDIPPVEITRLDKEFLLAQELGKIRATVVQPGNGQDEDHDTTRGFRRRRRE